MKAAAILVRNRRGSIAVSSALLLPVGLVLAAIAVDEGAIYAEQRNFQGLTDLAAIAAAAKPAAASEAALSIFRENGMAGVHLVDGSAPIGVERGSPTVKVEPGRYDDRASVAVSRRFTAGALPTNAVRVTLARSATQYFSSSFLPPPRMTVAGIAHISAQASLSLGSRLVALDDGIANAVLGSLLGAKLSLSAMDYRALASARVQVPALLDWTDRSLGLKAATYADLAEIDLPVRSLFEALATLPGLDKPAGASLHALAGSASRDKKVRIGKLFYLGAAGMQRAVGQGAGMVGTGGIAASAAAADIVGAAAALANRNSQVEADLGSGLPGILGLTIRLAIGEPMQASPWLSTDEEGAGVRTAQTRIAAVFEVAGAGGALGSRLKLPLYAEAAQAEATLSAIRCQSGRSPPASVSVDAKPGIADLRIAEVDPRFLADWKTGPRFSPAELVRTPLASATVTARLRMASDTATRLNFNTREIGNGTTKQAAARDAVATPVAAMLGNLHAEITVLGAGAGLPSLLDASLSRALNDSAKSVDLTLSSILATLGISLGQADVTVNGAACNRAVLVQ